jgi:Reverse transcriptase (RNA-dependent DNA polymerase)
MNVITAFLTNDLAEIIYIKPPEGCKAVMSKYYLLKKSIYDLKQAVRV